MLARGTGQRFGSVDAKEYFEIQTCRFRLFAEHDLLRSCGDIILSVWFFSIEMAWTAGGRLFDDRSRAALGVISKLSGEQEV